MQSGNLRAVPSAVPFLRVRATWRPRFPVSTPRAPPKACVESLPGPAEEAAPGCVASQFQTIGEMNQGYESR
jgi:hypothetical protein